MCGAPLPCPPQCTVDEARLLRSELLWLPAMCARASTASERIGGAASYFCRHFVQGGQDGDGAAAGRPAVARIRAPFTSRLANLKSTVSKFQAIVWAQRKGFASIKETFNRI
jgi:hypothetical protein